MSEDEVRMVILSTDDLDESIRFYSETLAMPVNFRDGAHFGALDGGPVTVALATAVDHPIPGQAVIGIKTASSKALTTTHTNAAPSYTTTRATASSSTSR